MSGKMMQLMDRLLQRWIECFDELGTIGYYKSQVKSYRYAEAPRYNLKHFENGKFSDKDDWTSLEVDSSWGQTYSFGLSDQGLPCYTASQYGNDEINWEGFYKYGDQSVEKVEFCLSTGIPSLFQRIEYHAGNKMVSFSVQVNGRGSYLRNQGMSNEEKGRHLINNPYDLFLSVEQYEVDADGRVIRADGIHRMPGIGQYTSWDEYNYDANNTLLTIRRYFDHGTDRLFYSQIAEGTSTEMIVDKMATALSIAVVDAIMEDRQKEAVRSGNHQCENERIGMVNLTYRYADNYYPMAGYQLDRTIKEDLEEGIFDFHSFVREASDINKAHLEDLYAQLEQIMDEEDDPGVGREMLRKTAAILVQTRLHGRLPVSDDFGVLALDGSIEGHSDEEMEEILLACGNDAATLSLWKEKGML
jgi:hypothetical protein